VSETPTLSPETFEKLREVVEAKTGIAVRPTKSYLIESRFGRVLEARSIPTFEALYDELAQALPPKDLLQDAVDAITTNETLWFRDDGPWEILRKQLIPAWVDELRAGSRSRVRIWSAACSTGQEPYSVSMMIHEHLEDDGVVDVKPEAFEIVATDISPAAVETAKSAAYDQLAASRGLPPQYLDRFFEDAENGIRVSEGVRSRVRIDEFNLQASFANLGRFDLVLCRNVLIYFSNALKLEIFEKLQRTIAPGGALVLGGSESANGAMKLFDMKRCGKHLYYVPKEKG